MTEKEKKSFRRSRLKCKYGITLEQYDTMLKIQNGVCAICKQPEISLNNVGTTKNLSVDHSHFTGKTRGLLCNRCNTLIGYLEHKLVLEANKYLRRYK